MKPIVVRENHPQAQHAIERWGELKTLRAPHESDWEDIARLIRPQRGGFSATDPASRKLEKPLNSEPVMAASSFAAGIYSSITNPANRWGGIETPDTDLNRWKPMAEWNDLVTRRILASFNPAVSGFYSNTYQLYADLAAFGQGAAYDMIDTKNRKFIDVSMSLAECVTAIDAHNRVNELVRKFTMSPRAAAREYGLDALPEKVREMAEKGATGNVTFYYHILPNDEFVKGKLGPKGKRFLAITACEEKATLVRIGGFEEMPAYYPRWDVDSGQTYGTGPGFLALASVRSLDLMTRATLRNAQMAADPTKLAPDRNAVPLNGVFRPGATVYGAMDMRGNILVRNMETPRGIGITMEEKAAAVEAIKEAFQYSVMSLVGRTGVTEEETRLMEEARLRNWAPHADRIMEEYGARKFERRFAMLLRAGQIPPPPEGVPAGTPLRVRYMSMATMAQHAREAQATRAFLNDLLPLAQLNPRYADRLDPDAVTEALHDASPSLPARLLRGRDEADAIGKARAEQEAQAQQMQMAQQGGGVVKDLAAAVGGDLGGVM